MGEISLRKIPLWIVLRRNPLHLYNSTSLSYIASAIGKPLYMDRDTMRRTYLDYARVCIELDAEDEIEDKIMVDTGNGAKVEIPILVPRYPERCMSCRAFGQDCKKSGKSHEEGETVAHIDWQQEVESGGGNCQVQEEVPL